MPIYRYRVIGTGEIFEVEQKISSKAITEHPITKQKIERIYDSPNLNKTYTAGWERKLSDTGKIKKAGFEILEKDKISGKYFKR